MDPSELEEEEEEEGEGGEGEEGEEGGEGVELEPEKEVSCAVIFVEMKLNKLLFVCLFLVVSLRIMH